MSDQGAYEKWAAEEIQRLTRKKMNEFLGFTVAQNWIDELYYPGVRVWTYRGVTHELHERDAASG